MRKLFVIKKYIWAVSAKDAIKKDKKTPVDDVWVDEDWKRSESVVNGKKIGFLFKQK